MSDLPQQASKLAEAAMPAGASLSTMSAAWAWIGTNHAEITATCAMLGLLITFAGFVISYRRKK